VWSLRATSLGGVGLAEIENASEREVAHLLARTNTASFQIPSSSPLTNYIASTAVLIQAYWGAQLRFHGRVISYNRVANEDGRSLAVVAADPSWVFSRRLVGKAGGVGRVFGTPTDAGLMAKTLIDEANVERRTGVRTGALPYLAGSSGIYVSGPFKPLSEAIMDLSVGKFGFDWTVEPIPYDAATLSWGDWRAAPVIGTYREDAIFHYIEGGGGNMKGITDSVEKTTQANRVYHFTEFGPSASGVPTVSASDPTTIADDGLYEDLAQAQLYDTALRQNLVNSHVSLRKHPRRIVTFQPQDHDPLSTSNQVPVFGVDYDLGDVVRARAEDEHGVWFDGYFRVYGWTAKPTNEGLESGDLVLVDEGIGSPGV
jgi:hypothetical protein